MRRVLSLALGRWVARIIFGVMAGAIAALPATDRYLVDTSTYILEISLATATPGVLQVFYDRGRGFNGDDAVAAPLRVSTTPVPYRLRLPAGWYGMFRIDPNDRAGRYTISRVRLLTSLDEPVAEIALSELHAANHIVVQRRDDMLVTTVPDGANDPQLLYTPREPIELRPQRSSPRLLLGVFFGAALIAVMLLSALEHLSGYWPERFRVHRPRVSPSVAIVIVAIAASLVATYPLLLGYSLVSPNNGGTPLVYDEPPFAFGSFDGLVEEARGIDVGSMMWAILPYSAMQRDAIAAGEMPLWNRHNTGGRPLWGQGQTFILEPVHLTTLAIPDAALRADVGFIAARAIFAIGIGLAAYLAIGALPPALVVATIAPFISYFIFRLNHPAYFSLVYAPWIVWAYFRLLTRVERGQLARGAALVAIVSALQIVGSTPKEGAIAFASAHLTGLIALLNVAPWRLRLRRVAAAIGGGLTAVALTAPHWLIFLDTLRRASTAYDVPTVQFGSVREVAAMALGPWMPQHPSLNGLATLLLLTAVVAPPVLRRNRAALAALVVGVICFAIALGAVPAAAFLALPLVRNIHHTWNVFITASLPPLLIASAAGAVAARRLSRGQAIALGIAIVVVIIVIDVSVRERMPAALIYGVAAAIVPAIAFVALMRVAAAAPVVTWVPAMVLALACALLPGGLHLQTPLPFLNDVLLQPRLRAPLETPPGAVRLVRARAGDEPFRVASVYGVMFGGTHAYFDLEGITGADALELNGMLELSDAAGIERTDWKWRTVIHPHDLTRAKGFLDLVGVRFVFGRVEHLPRDLQLHIPNPDPMPQLLRVMERPTAWPRAFFVDGVERYQTVAEFLARVSSAPFPIAAVDQGDAVALRHVNGLPASATQSVPATAYRLTPNSTSFRLDTPTGGIAVLSEAYVPEDLIVTLNGRPVSAFRVNHAFRGVLIPSSGSWTVVMAYRPRRWAMSWGIAAIGVVAWGVLMFTGRQHRKSGETPRELEG